MMMMVIINEDDVDDTDYSMSVDNFSVHVWMDRSMASYGQAIDQFGLPGINIDMIELTDRSPDKKYARAVQESQAIVFCDCLDPTPSLFLNKVMEVEGSWRDYDDHDADDCD